MRKSQMVSWSSTIMMVSFPPGSFSLLSDIRAPCLRGDKLLLRGDYFHKDSNKAANLWTELSLTGWPGPGIVRDTSRGRT